MDIKDALEWLGAEFVKYVGVRGVAAIIMATLAGLVGLTGVLGLFGRRYKETKQELGETKQENKKMSQRLEALERRQNSGVTQHVIVYAGAPEIGKRAVYDSEKGVMYFGTRHGDMLVRFQDAETIIDDVQGWLNANDMARPVSPDAVRSIIRQHRQADD